MKWRTKQYVVCRGWKGKRAIVAKRCPKCGHWHPTKYLSRDAAKEA